jgi:hypothetical protein
VLVGGVALQLRGFSGATRDLDITIAIDDLNTRRLDQALEALQAKPYLTGERGVAYSTRLGQIEVMRWTDGVGDYDAWTREVRRSSSSLVSMFRLAAHRTCCSPRRTPAARRTPTLYRSSAPSYSRAAPCKRAMCVGRSHHCPQR